MKSATTDLALPKSCGQESRGSIHRRYCMTTAISLLVLAAIIKARSICQEALTCLQQAEVQLIYSLQWQVQVMDV